MTVTKAGLHEMLGGSKTTAYKLMSLEGFPTANKAGEFKKAAIISFLTKHAKTISSKGRRPTWLQLVPVPAAKASKKAVEKPVSAKKLTKAAKAVNTAIDDSAAA